MCISKFSFPPLLLFTLTMLIGQSESFLGFHYIEVWIKSKNTLPSTRILKMMTRKVFYSSIFHYTTCSPSVAEKLLKGFKRVEEGRAGGDKVQGQEVFIKICTERPENDTSLQYEEYFHAAKVVCYLHLFLSFKTSIHI